MWWPEDQDAVRAHLRRVAVVKVDDTGSQQLVDLDGLASERWKGVVRLLPHGFSSNPPAGSEGMVLALGGRADRAMVLGLEDPKTRQKSIPAGTAVLYDDKGNVLFAQGKSGIAVNAKKGDVGVTSQSGNIFHDPGGGIVYLGGTGNDGGLYAPVLTVAGPSINVYARVG